MSNQKCENCIHFDMCAELIAYYHKAKKEKVVFFMCEDETEKLNCPHFKDKSLCVELPCRVGDEVWAVLSIGGIQWTDWYYIGQGKIINFEIDNRGLRARFEGVVCGTKIENHPVSISNICKTEEEAKAKKKEIEEK